MFPVVRNVPLAQRANNSRLTGGVRGGGISKLSVKITRVEACRMRLGVEEG